MPRTCPAVVRLQIISRLRSGVPVAATWRSASAASADIARNSHSAAHEHNPPGDLIVI